MKSKFIIKKYSFKQLSKKLKEELRKQVVLNFPKVKAFKTRFYYQIPPSYMFIAWKGKEIAGQRYLTTKFRVIDKKRYKIAGIGISINPKYQKQGLGQKLTKIVIDFAKNQKFDFIMATTNNQIAIHNLKKFNFVKLKRPITYKDVFTGKIEKEKEGVFVKDFQNGKLIKEIDKNKKPIYMGIGAW